jgi:hypothetical protein
MTIDAGWVKLVKKMAPEAFTSRCPFRPRVVFIDGQIKLMAPQEIYTWEAYFERQFLNTIESQFQTGAGVVVLGFDDYRHVPTAKAPTQRKRNAHVPVVTFDEADDLPARPPQMMGGAMRNRAFKTKVISYIVRRLRLHYKNETQRSVIIDYVGTPEVLGRSVSLPAVFDSEPAPLIAQVETKHEQDSTTPPIQSTLKRGECDIKAFVWSALGPLLIVSTDGDFVPMSLVQLECMADAQHDIVLYRMTTNTETGKRSASGSKKRTYEYVSIRKILDCLHTQIAHPQPARLFSMFCCLTGCDFTGNLPNLGPTRVWNNRHACKNLDTSNEQAILSFVCKLYLELFKGKTSVLNHQVRNLSPDTALDMYKTIEQGVRKGCVKGRIQEAFWHASRMSVHVRNVLWTMTYWKELHEYPNPLQYAYGFERIGNIVQFAVE